MSDRGIKKWAPYKSLIEQDFALKKQKEKEEKIEKPTISVDFAEEINEILINYHQQLLEIGYYRNGKILSIVDKIKRIDVNDKKLVLYSKKIIMLSDIVSIKEMEEEELWED